MSPIQPRPPDRPAPFEGRIGRTVADSESWWPPAVRAPQGAPNIVVVLVDDMGWSDIGPFGSEIDTPTLDGLAARGVRLGNYHTTPVCSPARAALLTGLNAHRAGYASVANSDPGFPGYTMELPEDVATLPEALRDAGYATYAVGKWHLTRDASMHDAASRRSWPLQRGFDRYYGTLEGLTNLHHPHRLVRDNSPVDLDRYPDGYYLTDDITDEAIRMVTSLRAADATKPFFLYVAHHAVHGPLMAKPEDIAKYRGRYGEGWDEVRRRRFARQIELGLFPPGTALPRRNFEPGWDVGAWAELDPERRERFARYQEVYAAMVDNIDQNLGRLLATIDALGELDNTIVVFASDNGGTAEGGPEGTSAYFRQFVHNPGAVRAWADRPVQRDLDLIGGPQALVHYPRGWGMASNTPFRLYKVNTHAGGIRVPFVLSWPAGVPARGELRHGYQYVTDIYPTLLDVAGIPRPEERHGRRSRPLDGVSFLPQLLDAGRPSDHREQYVELNGNRAYYRDGWKLVSLHQRGAPYDDSEWELYDIHADPTETRDVAADHPDVVKELSAAWEDAAWDNDVFPLDDGSGYLAVIRRPDEQGLRRSLTLLPGTPGLERYRSSRLIAFRSFVIGVDLRHGAGRAGVLVAHGDQGGGYVLYVEDGHLHAAYNEYGTLHAIDAGALDPGERRVELAFAAVEGYAWDLSVVVDGERRGRLPGLAMLIGLAPLEGISVGTDRRSPVSWPLWERRGPFPYDGELIRLVYTPGADAPYDPATVVAALRRAAAVFE